MLHLSPHVCWCLFLTLCWMLVAWAEEAEVGHGAPPARSLVEVRRLLKAAVGEPQRVALVGELVGLLLEKGKATEAWREVEALPAGSQALPRVALLRGRCLRALGQAKEAESALLPLAGVADAAVAVAAEYELAGLYQDAKRYEEAIAHCRTALLRGRDVSQADAETQALLRGVRTLLERAMDAFALARLGEDYRHYRLGRQAQARRDYATALAQYDLIKQHPVLKDARDCYVAVIRGAQGEVSEAERRFRSFTRENPYGLYRGEALVEWARLRLLQPGGEQALATTRELLAQAVAWCAEAPKQQPLLVVDDARLIEKYFPAPEAYSRPGDLAGLMRPLAGPEAIVNRLTAEWYLPLLTVQALLLQGYAASLAGDTAAAAAAMDQAVACNQACGGAFLKSATLRSELHAGVQAGAFLVPPEVWGRLGGDYGPWFRMACFFASAGEGETARGLLAEPLRRSQAAGGQRLRDHEQAVLAFGQAYGEFLIGKPKEAAAALTPFLGELKSAPLAPRAWLFLAHLKAGQADGGDEARELYLKVARRQDEAAGDALLALAVMACNRGDNALALSTCRELLKRFPESVLAGAATTLASRLDAGQGVVRAGLPAADPPGLASAAGRVLPVQCHLILPGSTALRTDFSGVRAPDLLQYQVTASPQSACIIVRGFGVNLTAHEPQLVPVVGRQASFIRAPVLFRHLLWAAPETAPTPYAVGSGGQLLFWREELEQLLAGQDYRAAERLVSTLRDGPATYAGYLPLLTADLARVYRESGAPAKAVALLKGADLATQTQPAARLELALALLATGDAAGATTALARAAEAKDPVIKTLAIWHQAQLASARQDHAAAAKLARQVLAALQTGPSQPALARLREPAGTLAAAADRAATVAAYGEPYWHYRSGRQAQARGDWPAALASYAEVKDPLLSEAAACYRGAVLAAQGETRQAIATWRQLAAQSPHGPYTAEALIDAARLSYLEARQQHEVEACRKLLQQAVAWGDARRGKAPAPAHAAVARDFPIAPRMSRPSRPGWPPPEAIVCQATAPWYVDYQMIRAQLLLTLVTYDLGDATGAATALASAADLLQQQGFGTAAMTQRLGAGLRGGAFLIPKPAWDGLALKHRQPIRLACFYYVSGQEWEAEPLLTPLAADEARLSPGDAAAVRLALASCLARRGEIGSAQRLLQALDKSQRQTPAGALADWWLQVAPR